MPKGYWIGRVDVNDAEGYKPYAMANNAIFKKFGARLLVRGGSFEPVEGSSSSASRRPASHQVESSIVTGKVAEGMGFEPTIRG